MRSIAPIAKVPAGNIASPILQRKCACGSTAAAGETCAACADDKKRRGLVQRKQAADIMPDQVPESVYAVLQSAGQPLDAATRNFMEPRFGLDFSTVRVHTDAAASASARDVHASAYTVGDHIVFAAGMFSPHQAAGRRLLAHELAHALQQRSISHASTSVLEVGEPHSRFELEADLVADRAMSDAAPAIGRVDAFALSPIATPVVMRACDKPLSFYESSSSFCEDKTFSTKTHKGKRCFREIMPEDASGCPPGDHCCFAPDGTVEDSRDRSSLAEGKEFDGSCNWNWYCVIQHTLTDYLPAVLGLDCMNACVGVPGPGKMWCLQSCFSRKH